MDRTLIVIGLVLVTIGLLVAALGVLGVRLGRLPGDIAIHRPGATFYFPLVTSILISLLLTLILWGVTRALRR